MSLWEAKEEKFTVISAGSDKVVDKDGGTSGDVGGLEGGSRQNRRYY